MPGRMLEAWEDEEVTTEEVLYIGHIIRTIVPATEPNQVATVQCRINNAEGYVLKCMPDVPVQYGNTNSQYSFFYETRDHLGNIISVWDAGHQWLTQQTTYWPSGMPFTWRGEQHVTEQLMNGHEYISMHGYDMYDFVFRHYYATIGRFTSPDPMSEQAPWQSPYVYASNNFTGEIDWMGLYVVTNTKGKILHVNLEHIDNGVYQVDEDDWDGTYWDLLRFEVIGSQIDGYIYNVGDYIGNGINKTLGGYYNQTWRCWVDYGTKPRQNASLLVRMFDADPSLVDIALQFFTKDVIDGFFMNALYNKNINRGETRKIISARSALMMKMAIKVFTLVNVGVIGYDMFTQGINLQNTSDAVILALSEYLSNVIVEDGVVGLATTLGVGIETVLITGAIYGTAYGTAKAISPIVNSFNTKYGNYEYMMDIYWNGF